MHCSSAFQFKLINSGDVEKTIKKLIAKNSSGHDGISTKLLQKIGSTISPVLSIIINQSLSTGIFPKSLKKGKSAPTL